MEYVNTQMEEDLSCVMVDAAEVSQISDLLKSHQIS
jgi:hypothetical protein